ncbi:MAG TPA: hypothetical protein PKY12_05925 [Catalimonadaceae bacterium]|nr:hypothetical protein [Catalimonadaceae bacterium]
MRNLILASVALGILAYILTLFQQTKEIAMVGIQWFVPLMAILFLGARFLADKLGKLLDQPPLMVFLMALVMKLLGGLTILMVYLAKGLGPAMEGSFLFLGIYLILEILEIKWFLSILRPDSRENTPE